MRPALFRQLVNLWPPFFFNSIAVTEMASDWSLVKVRLRRRLWNRNYIGTHFGGNLFAMADPFWMLMVMHRLGPDYVVLDKAGSIEFIAPGRGDVYATFQIDAQTIDSLRSEAAGGEKVLRWFEADVVNKQGELIAKVSKQIYIRRKRERRNS
jgi:acyl-coenzyme A thioesterase PaaI-like protein